MISFEGVSKTYGETVALAPTTYTFEAGRTTVLIGPSGCGKSTILRLAIGLIWPTRGRVLFEGTPLAPETIRPIRHRMGYVIQEGGLFPHLTARENVTLLARHLKKDHTWIEGRVRTLADLVHLPEGRLDDYPGQLSGGQRQRVGLMRALMLDPDVLLLDEPLGALDPMILASLQEDLRDIFQQLHKTVILVTHDLAEAGYFADTVLLLREGRIIQQGPFQDLLQAPTDPFVASFVRAQRTLHLPIPEA